MAKVPKMFRLPGDLVARLEARCGELGQTQTVFVVRALEAALEKAGPGSGRQGEAASASPRAPENRTIAPPENVTVRPPENRSRVGPRRPRVGARPRGR